MVNNEVILSPSPANEKGYRQHMVCSPTTKSLIVENCVEEYLKHHPEMKGFTVTHEHILRQLAEFYLKST